MSIFARDSILNKTSLRESGIVAYSIEGSASDSGWYRLMPDGIAGSLVGDYAVSLSNLRNDVDGISFEDWLLIVANDGFKQARKLLNSDDANLRLDIPVEKISADGTVLDENDIRYILVPRLLNPLRVYFGAESQGKLEFAFSRDLLKPGASGYSREVVAGETITSSLFEFIPLEPGRGMEFPFVGVENIFYRFTDPSDDNRIHWGENRVSRRSGGITNVVFVPEGESLPGDTDADEDTLYIREIDKTLWLLGLRTIAAVAAVAGSITNVDLVVRTGATWSDEHLTDPVTTALAYYYNISSHLVRTKPSGPLSSVLTTEAFSVVAGSTWLDELDADPAIDGTASRFYYNRTTGYFRHQPTGPSSGTITAEEFTPEPSGSIGTYLGAFASAPTAGADRETYYDTTLNAFRQHSPGQTSYFSLADSAVLGSATWLGDTVRTIAQALIYFVHNGFSGSTVYVYYDENDDRLTRVTLYSPPVSFGNSSLQDAVGDAAVVWLGMVGGATGSEDVSTEAEALAWIASNDPSKTGDYYYYDEGVDDVLHIDSFTLEVEWIDSSIESAVDDATAYLLPVSVNSEAGVVAYYDDEANTFTGRPFYYDVGLGELREVTAYVATIEATPEHTVPEVQQIPTSGSGGLTQPQVDARVRLLALLVTDAVEVNSQTELDAVDTANKVVFARVMTAFATYNLNDYLVYDGTNDRWVVIFTQAGSGIVDLSGGFPQASAAYLLSIGVLGDNLYRCIEYQTAATPAGSDPWPNYAHANYLGARSSFPGLQDEHVGNFYYDTTNHYFRRARIGGGLIPTYGWERVSATAVLGSNADFLGEFNSEQEALNRIGTYDSTKVYYAYYGGVVHVLDGSTYTVPVGPVTRYEWVHANADIARVVAELESQLSLHWDSVLPDRRITGNTTETFDFDIGQLAAFLGIDRSYAELTLSFTYEPSASVSGTVVATLLHGTDTIVDETLNFLTDTEQSVSVSARITDATNGISLRLAVSGLSDVSNSVLFTGITLNIVGGFVPEASQIEFDTTQFTRRLDPSTIQTLQQFVDFFDAISYPSLPNVADQAALDAVSTASIVAFAKVTGVFASWQINDVIFWNGTAWTLFLRTQMLSLPAQVTSDEIESATETLVRSSSPEDIFNFIRTHETRPWTTSFMNAAYRTTLSSQSGVEFNFNTVGGNTYLRFNSLGSHRQIFVEGLEVGSVIGFFNMTARTTELFRVRVNGDYASDTGLPVIVPDGYAGHLNGTDSYLIEFSQGLPDLGQTEAEVIALIESNVPSPFRNTDVPIPFGESFLYTPIAWGSEISGVLLGEDSDDLDDNYAGFIFNTVSGQEYVRVQGLLEADQSFFSSLGSGVIIGFYRNGVRQSLAMVSGDYDATNGLPISNRLGSLTTTYVQYDFFLSEDRSGTVSGDLAREHNRGAWVVDTQYVSSDFVSHGGFQYLALVGNTGVEPGVTTNWGNSWLLLRNLSRVSNSEIDGDVNPDSDRIWTQTLISRFVRRIAPTATVVNSQAELNAVSTTQASITFARVGIAFGDFPVNALLVYNGLSWQRFPSTGGAGFPSRHIIVNREFQTGTVTSGNQLELTEVGLVGTIGISQFTDLPTDYLEDIIVGSAVTMQGQTSGAVRVGTITSKTTADTTASLVCTWTTQSGTFVDGETVEVGFGYVQSTEALIREEDLRNPEDAAEDQFYIDEDGDEVVEKLAVRDRADDPYFHIVPANLGTNQLGYSRRVYSALTLAETVAGGTSAELTYSHNNSGFEAIVEEHLGISENNNRWVLRMDPRGAGLGSLITYTPPVNGYEVFDDVATGIVAKMQFLVAKSGNDLLGPVSSGSDVTLDTNLTIGMVQWNAAADQFHLLRANDDTGIMSAFWASRNDDLSVFIRFPDGEVVEIGPSDYASSTLTYARWLITNENTYIRNLLSGLEDNDTVQLIVAEAGSVPWGYERLKQRFYLRFSDNERPIELTPDIERTNEDRASMAWSSAPVTRTDAFLVVGTGKDMSLFDENGVSLYVAPEKRIVFAPIVLHKDEEQFITYQHHNMPVWGTRYANSVIYPNVANEVESVKNAYRIRKFRTGNIRFSSNRGGPLENIEWMVGPRGNVDVHTGEAVGSRLIPNTVALLGAGYWKMSAGIHADSGVTLSGINLFILEIMEGVDFPVSVVYGGGGTSKASGILFNAPPSEDGNIVAPAFLSSAPIYTDGTSKFVLIWESTADDESVLGNLDWQMANCYWGFNFLGNL